LLLADLEGQGRFGSRHDVEAGPEGWRWSAPLPDRLSTGFVYSSAVTDEPRARRLSGTEGAELVPIRPGRRREPWLRNVLALGDASVALDPLHGTGLHLAQSAILRALELLPGRDFHPLELREYNRRTEWETLRVRDFLALHYLRSGRAGPLWERLAGRAPPDSLGRTLEQFERRGRLPFFEEEAFDGESWSAALLGLGVLPRDVDPAGSGVDVDAAARAMAALAERLDEQAARLPLYGDYLKQLVQRVRQRPR
jgi:tryptophan halogenase